ncbi:MAG: helix-turn-helix domain-containing protein [Acidobacteriota bacterium]
MAKSFYTAEEAAKKLGKQPESLTDLVKQGKLREFRDGGEIRYKAEDVDALAGPSESSGSEIVLEPAEDDSSIVLSASGSDVLSLDELEKDEDSGGTAGTAAPGAAKADAEKKKGDTVVSSVGISVFDDDELDEVVDPLAQTAVSDVAGLGVEGIGSGSGILDLTRESDDTSLGAELLEEIYSGEEQQRSAAEDIGSKTSAGLAGVAEAEEVEDVEVLGGPAQEGTPRRAQTLVSVPAAEDAFSSGLTAAMVVATLVMCIGGLASAALVRGVTPSIISMIYGKMLYFAGGSLLLVIIATVVTFFLAKRSS